MKGDIIMKKIISTVLVCVLLLGCVMSLASCGKMLSGKYELELTESNVIAYEFSFNKVTRTVTTGALGFTKESVTEGTYKITETDDQKYSITFTWEVDGEEDIETVSFSKGEDYIELSGLKFTKVKK